MRGAGDAGCGARGTQDAGRVGRRVSGRQGRGTSTPEAAGQGPPGTRNRDREGHAIGTVRDTGQAPPRAQDEVHQGRGVKAAGEAGQGPPRRRTRTAGARRTAAGFYVTEGCHDVRFRRRAHLTGVAPHPPTRPPPERDLQAPGPGPTGARNARRRRTCHRGMSATHQVTRREPDVSEGTEHDDQRLHRPGGRP
jgi:hypothetical protein